MGKQARFAHKMFLALSSFYILFTGDFDKSSEIAIFFNRYSTGIFFHGDDPETYSLKIALSLTWKIWNNTDDVASFLDRWRTSMKTGLIAMLSTPRQHTSVLATWNTAAAPLPVVYGESALQGDKNIAERG